MVASIRYMGNKKALASEIASALAQTHPLHTVVDVFAGTCAIACEVAPTNRVVVNDVHAFAATIGRALLTGSEFVPTSRDVSRDIRPRFDANVLRLKEAVGDRASEEDRLLKVTSGRRWRQYFDFVHGELEQPIANELVPLKTIFDYRRRRTRHPYSLFTYLYTNTYFGIQQCIEIDSIRLAIDAAPASRRNIYLLALLQAASHCASAPGHFAQFLVPRDRANTQLVARYRRRSIWSRFTQALSAIELPRCKSRARNLVFNENAHAFAQQVLPRLAATSRLVVYADPPYSRAQYSRYYHLLETLVQYDYPKVTGKGRYRGNRYETNFSRVGQVLPAMCSFVGAIAATRAPLFLSYPDNGLVFEAGGDIRQILEDRYPNVEIVISQTLSHSTMGGAPGSGAIPVMEHVYHASF